MFHFAGLVEDELDRVSLSSPASELPGMKRQGSKISYGSNDSNGSSTSTGIFKVNEQAELAEILGSLCALVRSRDKKEIWKRFYTLHENILCRYQLE